MKDKSSLITALIVGAGGFAIYWYVTNYGPNGAVSAGAVSWWNTWFGATAALPAPGPVQAGSGTPAPGTTTTQPPAQSTPPPAAQTTAMTVQVVGAVTNDINNSLKATVMINGQSMTINIIPANAGGTSGVIYNTNGADITAQFSSAQQAQIVLAIQSAAAGASPAQASAATDAKLAACIAADPTNPARAIANCNLSGIVPVPWHQTGANLSGMNFKGGKGFVGGFGARKTPLVN